MVVVCWVCMDLRVWFILLSSTTTPHDLQSACPKSSMTGLLRESRLDSLFVCLCPVYVDNDYVK